MSNLMSLKHALDMWKHGQVDQDPLMIQNGARSVDFWREMERAAEYKSKVTSEGTK